MKSSGLLLALSLMLITSVAASAEGLLVAEGNSTVTSTRTVSDENGVRSSRTTVTSTSSGPLTSGALFSILDNRRYELDRKIGLASVSGTLGADTTSKMQAQSDHVRLLMLDRGNVLTEDQAINIAKELDALDVALAATLKVNAMTPLTIVDTTSGTTKIVSDQFGNVIAVSDVGPDIYIKTLEERRVELENIIAAGQASGTISAAHAKDLRAELDHVAQMQNGEQVTSFTYVNALPLAMSLDYVGSRLTTVVPTITYVPLINGGRFAIVGGRVIMLDDVMVRRADLESKIARLRANGKISVGQASNLRAELGRIALLEKQLRAQGSFTYKGSRELYNRFDKVGSRLDGYQG